MRLSGIILLSVELGAVGFHNESLRRKVNYCLMTSAERLMPEPNSFNVEIDVEDIKIYKSPGIYI